MMPPTNPMTPQRLREIARNYLNHIRDSHIFMEKYAADVEALGEFADQLERNAEREGKYGEYCTRNSGHDGPCNGLPRKDCVLPKPPEAK